MKNMEKNSARTKKNRGSCTLEALIALTAFVISVLSVILFSNVVRAEKCVQLALDKTAEEISEGCYAASLVCDRIHDGINSARKDSDPGTDALLGGADAFLSMARGSFESADIGTVASALFSGTLEALAAGDSSVGEAFYTSLSQYGDTPAAAVAGIAGMLLCDEISEFSANVSASFLCRLIMPKYLGGDGSTDTLEKLGIRGGVSGIDFSNSEVLPDGRGVKLVAVYPVSLFPWKGSLSEIRLTSVSYTLSWCEAGDYESEPRSVWSYDNFRRGKLFVASVKKQYPSMAVKAGYGFDLYNASSGEFTSVVSMNVFAKDYSSCSAADRKKAEAGDFTLTEKGIVSELKSDAVKLKKSVAAIRGAPFELESGERCVCGREGGLRLIVIVPEECSIFEKELESAAQKVQSSTDVRVVFRKKGKALKLND